MGRIRARCGVLAWRSQTAWISMAPALLLFVVLGACKAKDPLAGDQDTLGENLTILPEVPEDEPESSAWQSTGPTKTDDPAPVLMEPESSERYHVVRKGDTLMALARHYYQDASRWRLILESNRDQISNPNVVRVGQRLRIP